MTFTWPLRTFWNLGTISREEAQRIPLVADGHFAITLRRLDGHWCDIVFTDHEGKRAVHLSVELNDSQIAALTDWIVR